MIEKPIPAGVIRNEIDGQTVLAPVLPRCSTWRPAAKAPGWKQIPPVEWLWAAIPILVFAQWVFLPSGRVSVVVILAAFALRMVVRYRHRTSDAAVMADPQILGHLEDSPSELRQIPVAIYLRAEGKKYAQDHGVIAFNDGWLVYQGLRTSFQLHRANVCCQPLPWFVSAGSLIRLDYRLSGRDFVLTMRPLVYKYSLDARPGGPISREFRNWEAMPMDWAGVPSYPPLYRAPDNLSAAYVKVNIGVAVCTLLGFLLLCAMIDHQWVLVSVAALLLAIAITKTNGDRGRLQMQQIVRDLTETRAAAVETRSLTG